MLVRKCPGILCVPSAHDALVVTGGGGAALESAILPCAQKAMRPELFGKKIFLTTTEDFPSIYFSLSS